MVFFTRKGLTVPEFPALNAETLDEEDVDICVPTIPPLPLCHAPAYNSARHNTTAAPTYSESVAAAAAAAAAATAAALAAAPFIVKDTTPQSPPVPGQAVDGESQQSDPQYDYVVDRTLGVEV